MSSNNHNQNAAVVRFPQEPVPPFPYRVEEVTYENRAAQVTLSGTLTMPHTQKPVPAVLLIAGHGPNDRDAALLGHKRFMVLADHLTRHGIAVLRFDKRGVGSSTGVYETATSRDFADDARAGIEYLKARPEIDHNKIGLIGHSEGGMIASMIAAESSDIAFVVLMAGCVLMAVDDLVIQTAHQLRADGATPELLAQDKNIRAQILTIAKQVPDAATAKAQLLRSIESYWDQLPEAERIASDTIPFAISEAKADAIAQAYSSAWYHYFLNCQPEVFLSKITVPVLGLYGEHDWIALSRESREIIESVLKKAGNTDYTTVELPGLNHSLQPCQTGSLAEYATIKETIAPEALKMMADWLVERFCD